MLAPVLIELVTGRVLPSNDCLLTRFLYTPHERARNSPAAYDFTLAYRIENKPKVVKVC